MADPTALAARLVALAARLAEIRANHAGCEAVWQQWIAEGQIEPDKVLPTPICCLCDVFGAFDALAEAVELYSRYNRLSIPGPMNERTITALIEGKAQARAAMLALARAGRGGTTA